MRNPFPVALTAALFAGFGGIAVLGALDALLTPRPAAAAVAATGPGLADEVKSPGFFQGSWSCHGQFPASGRTIASAEQFAPKLLLASSGQPLARFVFERKDANHYIVDYSRVTGKQAWAAVDTLQTPSP